MAALAVLTMAFLWLLVSVANWLAPDHCGCARCGWWHVTAAPGELEGCEANLEIGIEAWSRAGRRGSLLGSLMSDYMYFKLVPPFRQDPPPRPRF